VLAIGATPLTLIVLKYLDGLGLIGLRKERWLDLSAHKGCLLCRSIALSTGCTDKGFTDLLEVFINRFCPDESDLATGRTGDLLGMRLVHGRLDFGR
jgi:hypothetical protein